jgi:hypothetical protein
MEMDSQVPRMELAARVPALEVTTTCESGAMVAGGVAFEFSERIRRLVFVDVGNCPEERVLATTERLTNVNQPVTPGKLYLGEPSTIYLAMSVERPADPDGVFAPHAASSYEALTPGQRWVYLHWLEHPDTEVNASYAFIFLQGLERRMMLDSDPREAFHEVLALRRQIGDRTFQSRSESSLLVMLLQRHHPDLAVDYFKSNPTACMSNLALSVSQAYGNGMTAQGFVGLARYYTRNAFKPGLLEKYPTILRKSTKRVLVSRFGSGTCPFPWLVAGVDAPAQVKERLLNDSLPSGLRVVQVPQIVDLSLFRKRAEGILLEAQDLAVRHLSLTRGVRDSHGRAPLRAAQPPLKAVLCPACGALLDRAPGTRRPCFRCGTTLYHGTDPETGEHLLLGEDQHRAIHEKWRAINVRNNAERVAYRFRITPTQLEKRRLAGHPGMTSAEVVMPLLRAETENHAHRLEWSLWRANQVLIAELLMDDARMPEALQVMFRVCDVCANELQHRPSASEDEASVSFLPKPDGQSLWFRAADLFRVETALEKLGLSDDAAEEQFLLTPSTVDQRHMQFTPNDVWHALLIALQARRREAGSPSRGRLGGSSARSGTRRDPSMSAETAGATRTVGHVHE